MRGAYSLVFDDARVSFLFFFISFPFVCILGWGIGYRWVRARRERGLELDKTAASQAVSNAVREDVREKKACISADTG